MENAVQEGPVTRANSFLKESVEELRKVHKPTRQETLQATFVTIAIMVFVSVILALMDFVFRWLMQQII